MHLQLFTRHQIQNMKSTHFSLRNLLFVIACIAIAVALLRHKFFEYNAKYLIPRDLYAYLARGPLVMDTSADEFCQLKEVEFYSIDELRVRKFEVASYEYYLNYGEPGEDPQLKYEITGVDLLKKTAGYFPEGILIWFPQLNEFGAYDADHRAITMLPGVTWKDIESNPSPYVNCQWYPDDLKVGKLLRPWADQRCKDMRGVPDN